MFIKEFITLFFFFLSLSSIAQGNPRDAGSIRDFMEATFNLQSKHTLNYGDTCSYSDEQKGVQVAEKIAQAMLSPDTSGLSAVTREINNYASSVGPLCNSNKLYECVESGKCVCLNQAVVGVQMNSSYDDANGKCRLIEGNPCVPQEATKLIDPGFGENDMQCGFGTSCKVGETREECSLTTMGPPIRKLAQEGKLSDPESMVKAVWSTCKCLI